MSEGSAGAAPAAGLLEFARQAPQWQKLARTGEARQHGHLLYGLTGSQKPFLAAALFDYPSSGEPALYVTPDLTRAQAAKEDLQALVPAERVYLLPPREGFPHDIEARSPEVETERLQALEVLVHGTPGCLVVAPVAALLSCLPPVERWRQATFELAVGEELPPEKLAQRLANLGYSRESQVEAPGQFAVRGHVVDIFSATAQLPARVEYFGDTIDSIRTFDPGDQRSRDSCESLGVFLAREVILTPTEREQGLGELS